MKVTQIQIDRVTKQVEAGSLPEGSLKDIEAQFASEELQKVNLVVERRCFCKGTAGFFKIIRGNLKLNIEKNELTLSGNFSNKKLPLLVTKIDEKVSLE